MRDIIKYFIGIVITLSLIISISKYFNKDTNEEKIVQGVRDGVKTLSENSMIQCIDRAVPSISTINEEYKNIAKEDDEPDEDSLLQEILKTEISSIRGFEEIEEKEQQEIQVANQEENKENSEQIQLARNRSCYTSNYE